MQPIPTLMFYTLMLVSFALTVSVWTGPAAHAAQPDFVGTPVCASCHAKEHANWLGSHHDLAMQRPTSDSVLGDFEDARFDYFDTQTRFFRRDERFIVQTDGPDGKLRDYEVEWVFGVYPLQQYLLAMDDGRLQALSIAWDSRPPDQGGQRWYHLYPDEYIAFDDPLHWTGPYQNWNTRCAECHSTNVEKNYDAGQRRFDTNFFEEDVGCEACHGPGGRHVDLAYRGQLPSDPQRGLLTELSARGEWVFAPESAIATRRQPLQDQQQIDGCGRCHARRGTLGDYHYGQPLSDTHRVALLGQPLYHHDGQILDEVYVYGSFLQSKMHQAGVVCADCHEPHSNQLRASGNGVCAQCHRPSVFDTTDHHRHPADSSGAQCVNCHMPAQIYMGVDARRDHSMRIPRPDLSAMTGTPNACNACHAEQDNDWAVQALRDWGIRSDNPGSHPAAAMAAAQRGDTRAASRLLSLAANDKATAIWRATALERAATLNVDDAVSLARSLSKSADPLLRVSAARTLAQLPPSARYRALAALMVDPVSGVRMEVAAALASMPLQELNPAEQKSLRTLFDEYLKTQGRHADMPSVQMQLGGFHTARGDFPRAEIAYREAIAINPQLIPAYLNLADLLRGVDRDEEARALLQEALSTAPESGDAMHALGLLEARAGAQSEALRWLREAAEIETQGARHRFVYAIAQHDYGDAAGAIVTLRRLHSRFPADEEVLLALCNYSAETQQMALARRYAQKLVSLDPANARYRQLASSLGADGS